MASTTTTTSNPYNFNITEDLEITPTFVPVIATGSIKYSWTSSHNGTVSFTPPAHITRVQVKFTRAYNSDERSQLRRGLNYGPGSGCGIRNEASSKNWFYYNANRIVQVTPKKTYTLRVWTDGYKGRELGFILSWSPDINNLAAQIVDT